jgi:hypothetical protein
MSTVIRKELKIFRGTYDEVKAVPTEDMTIYLAWDTGEIFVGNAIGNKTPYTGGGLLSERQVKELIESTVTEVIGEDMTLLNSQVTTINISNQQLTVRVGNLETAFDNIEEGLDSTISEKLQEIAESGILTDYYTKEETDARVVAKVEEFTYDKNEIETKIPDVSSFITASYVDSQISGLTKYNSIENLVTPSALVDLTEVLAKPDGVYLIKTVDYGFEILIISKGRTQFTRIAGDGHSYSLVGSEWVAVNDKNEIYVSTINNLTPVNGNVSITLDSIPDTSSRKINTLLPQSVSGSYIDAINPLGRNTNKTVGDGSISFGKNSSAEGENAIALGLGAIADGENTIQLGSGSNTVDNTFKVFDKTVLNSEGKIPNDILIERFSTIELTIPVLGWSNGESKLNTVEAIGVTTSSLLWINPSEENDSFDLFVGHEVRAVQQLDGQLVFKARTVPTGDIKVNVLVRN